VASGTYRETLSQPGLRGFLATQFLGAFNDNVCKIIVTFPAIKAYGPALGPALIAVAFILPFMLFSGYAGHWADVTSKRKVLIATKACEVVVMLLMVPVLMLTQQGVMWPLIGTMFLLSSQATFFSPAKYGIIPELLGDKDLSRANGLLEMSTFVAIVLGTTVGGEVFEIWQGDPWITGGILIVIAVLGSIASLFIGKVPASKPGVPFSLNPFDEIGLGLRRLWRNRTLWLTAVGIAYFWAVGSLLQMVLLPLGENELFVGKAASTRLFTSLAIGIAAGSLTAGRLSGDKIEVGLVPLGSIGMGLSALFLVWVVPSYALVAVAMFVIGFFSGCFVVPLNALMQHRPDADEKGRILATNNFLQTGFILLASAVVAVFGEGFHWTSSQILLLVGFGTLAGSLYAIAVVPDFFVRFVLWILAHTIYRIRVIGDRNVPIHGPALLISNHMSMMDGAFIGSCVQRFVRFMVYGPHFRMPGLHWLLQKLHAIPITAGHRKEVTAALDRARAELQKGHVVCIFAEGAISRTGNMLPFRRGFEKIVEGLDVPVIPVYLDGVWGSIFSFKRGRFLWKFPERFRMPITVAFGKPLPSTATAAEVRLAILELGTETAKHKRGPHDLLHVDFMRAAKRRWSKPAMSDSTGQKLTFGRALIGSLLLARLIRARTPGEDRVGLLLPASVGGALANIATLAADRTPVNLNFTTGAEMMDAAIEQAGIRTILTSKRFLEKAGIAARPEMVFLEDLRGNITAVQKIVTLLQARLFPLWWLRRHFGGKKPSSSLATIVFSSGSTGVPKGVMLTHANLLSNVDALAQIFPFDRGDVFVGVLPFFHSFGLTGTLWFPLLQDCAVVYHPNPMDAKTVGELAGEQRARMIISTPTFCNAYLRRCTKEQFGNLKYAVVGAEKLREPLATAFEQQFGVGLLEGYGCTEMSPVVAVNRPNVDHGGQHQVGVKFGSVGHTIPGVAAKVVDQETGEGPLIGREGLLLVKGPNLMAGYLDQPELTAQVMRDGWYVTGDIAAMDEDGFIFITDRLSRFSKIAGEMVPHLKLEDAINGLLGDLCAAVTAVPDASRGERLVAFYTRADITPETLWDRLNETDLPKLWIPRRDSLHCIGEIPTLGTGKVDLRRLKQLAVERAGVPVN
jgi:acyl-[acyl-carrier-protein]-phospholipid O-acyltransferase/long-chain-fatty-acid--[acyl-carrier-protein] ligase